MSFTSLTIVSYTGHGAQTVNSVAFSPNGSEAITGGGNGLIGVWRTGFVASEEIGNLSPLKPYYFRTVCKGTNN